MVSGLGVATVLVMPVCQETGDYDYGLVKGDVPTYFANVIDEANGFLNASSDGLFSLEATILEPMEMTMMDCGGMDPLTTTDSIEKQAQRLARDRGYEPLNYDIEVAVIPYCDDLWWDGWARVGRKGMVLNLRADDYDAMFVHELGHNLGLGHGACVLDGDRGAVAYIDDDDVVHEYCSPYTPLGSDVLPTSDFLAASKIFVGWIPESRLATYDPSSDAEYTLLNGAADDFSNSSSYAAVRVATTSGDARYYYMEYHAGSVLMYWVEFQAYRRGRPSMSILVDTTPFTPHWHDAALEPGRSFDLDLSGPDEAPFFLTVSVLDARRPDQLTVVLSTWNTSVSGAGTVMALSSASTSSPSSSSSKKKTTTTNRLLLLVVVPGVLFATVLLGCWVRRRQSRRWTPSSLSSSEKKKKIPPPKTPPDEVTDVL